MRKHFELGFISGFLCVVLAMLWTSCSTLESELEARRAKEREVNEFVRLYWGQDVGEDPWGKPYQVKKTTREGFLEVIIRSAGSDRTLGTEDDIVGRYHQTVSVEIRQNE